jgi:protein O-mannosyl-transferase
MEPAAAPDPLPSWVRVGLPAGIFLLAFLCFTPALSGGFLNWDDNLVLTDHEAWRGLGSEQIRWAFSTHHSGHYHPLTWLSFGLDYELWGMNPRGYHLVNLVLHATTAVLFYFILVHLLASREIRTRLAATAGALFFAIHPLRVESVAWITERRDALSGCLLVLSVLAWLTWTADPRRRWYALALVAFALSLLSKAWGITLPVVLVLLDVHPLRRGIRLREKIPFFVLAIAAAIAAYLAQKRMGAMGVVPNHDFVDRIVQSGYGLYFYVAKTLLPLAPNPLVALKPSFNPFEAKYLLGAAAAVAVTIVLILLRRRRPELLTAWAIFVVSVAPVLGMTQAGPQLVAERYSYLSCLPFAVLAAAAVIRWRKVAAIVAVVVLAAFGVQAWRYCHDWQGSIPLWTRAVGEDPENTQAWFNLGSAKLYIGDHAGAFSDLSRVVELDPKYATAYNNRGIARMERDPAGAIADFEAAARILPDYADAIMNRGWVRFGTKDVEGGLADFDAAIKINPNHYQAHLLRGIAKLGKRDLLGAKEDLATAIRLKPREPDAWYVRGQARDEAGDIDGAIADYAQALNVGGKAWDRRKRTRAESLLAQAKERKARSGK